MTKRSHSLRRKPSLTQARKRVTALALRGKYRSAADCLKHALRLSTEVSAEKLELWNELGILCKYAGEFAEAERCYRFALKSCLHCYQGQQLQFFRANLYHNLGGLEYSRQRYRVGEQYTRKALQLRCQASRRNSLGVERYIGRRCGYTGANTAGAIRKSLWCSTISLRSFKPRAANRLRGAFSRRPSP